MVNSGPTTSPSDPSNMRDPVRGSAWITAHLRQAIREGRYAHGEKLPAERQFAEAFGASRATIRSALIRLETERLVTRRLGAGTFVNYDNPGDAEDVAELTSPPELIHVRLAEYNQQHEARYEAIRTRDVEGAVGIITSHLHFARRQLLGAKQGGGD